MNIPLLARPKYVRAADAAYSTYRNRVLADSGTLETPFEVQRELRRLSQLGLLDSLSLGYIAGAYGAGKWYNIKGATGDLDVVRASTADRTARNGATETVGNNITAVDYDSGVLKGVQCFPASAPRAADDISKTGIASEIGQAEGVIYAEVDYTNVTPGVTKRALTISDGSASNRIGIAASASSPFNLDTLITLSGSVQSVSISSALGKYRVAISYSSGGFVIVANGQEIGSGTFNFTNSLSVINIGHQFGLNQWNDNFYSNLIWKTTKPIEKLIALTTL